MCGPDRYSELYDTNMPLEIKQSSWQKAVNEKGILKGSVDYFTDQISVFMGTDKMDEFKKDGMIKSAQKTWGDKNKICQQEYENTFSVEDRASHSDKYKETWINDCIKKKKAAEKCETNAKKDVKKVEGYDKMKDTEKEAETLKLENECRTKEGLPEKPTTK